MLDAKPRPIVIDTAGTVVIVVDMQNDFGSKGGMFDGAGIDISRIHMWSLPRQGPRIRSAGGHQDRVSQNGISLGVQT
jgi:hypothetical protein